MYRGAVLYIFVFLSGAAFSQEAERKLADISWMAGSWQAENSWGLSEETWGKPMGDSMLGMYKLVKDGKVAFYEIMIIVEENDNPILKLKHFTGKLKGWEEKDIVQEFPLTTLTANEAAFGHIAYKKVNDNTLMVMYASDKDGGKSVTEFLFQRVQ
jgi:Domain of unknown function (DUF6265)